MPMRSAFRVLRCFWGLVFFLLHDVRGLTSHRRPKWKRHSCPSLWINLILWPSIKKIQGFCWNDNLKPRLWRYNKYYTGSSEHVSVQGLADSVSMDGKDLIQSSGSVMAGGEINKTFRHAKHSTHDSKARCDRWATIQRGCDEVRAGVRSLLQR